MTVADCRADLTHTPALLSPVGAANWREDASAVADPGLCACGVEAWRPRRLDLRVAADWPPPSCDWGGCDGDGVAERYCPEMALWLPVCRVHTGLRVRRPSPGRGDCSVCGAEYTLSVLGLVRVHDRGFAVRCPGGGRAPAQAGSS